MSKHCIIIFSKISYNYSGIYSILDIWLGAFKVQQLKIIILILFVFHLFLFYTTLQNTNK